MQPRPALQRWWHWWLLLTSAIAYQRQRFTPAWRQRINRASALLLGGFALWQWGQLV